VYTRVQIPLILAWALTIHKCQSATLDCVIVDLGPSIFSDNMGYVALSRCRNLSSVFISSFIPSKISCHPEAKEFEVNLRLSKAIKQMAQYDG
jgi:ATP-dependent DNA helicase PIF1